jgi:hypothetical protein
MKLPNCTKKRETRATIYTFKIMRLIKREMKQIETTKINSMTELRGDKEKVQHDSEQPG